MSDWYYAADNAQKGPVNESELKADLAAHKLPADTLVWKDGMDNWTPANQVAAFTFRPPPEPAAVQPAVTPAPAAAKAFTPAPAPQPASKSASSNPDSTKPVDVASLLGTPEPLEVAEDDADRNKILGIIAYLWALCLVTYFVGKESPFAKYHANQGFVLFVLEIVISIVLYAIGLLLAALPSFLGFMNAVFGLLYLVPLGLMVWGIINAAAGKCVPLPVIGGIKLLK